MKLKIRLVEFEERVAMQILEQEGMPEQIEEGEVRICTRPDLYKENVVLRGANKDYDRDIALYETPEPKAYIQKVISWIDDFFVDSKFPCLCCVWNKNGNKKKRVVIGQMHRTGEYRVINVKYMPADILHAITNYGISTWPYAELIGTHKQEGDIYTWGI